MCVCLAIALVWATNFSISSEAVASASASRRRLLHLVGQPPELGRAGVEPLPVPPRQPRERRVPLRRLRRPRRQLLGDLQDLARVLRRRAHHQRLLVAARSVRSPVVLATSWVEAVISSVDAAISSAIAAASLRVLADRADQVAQLVQHRADRAGEPVLVPAPPRPLRNAEVALRHPAGDRLREPGRPEHPLDQEEDDRELHPDRREREAERAADHQPERGGPVHSGRSDDAPEQRRDDRREQRDRHEPRHVQADDQFSGDGAHTSDVPV